jgi:hypothetical protein
MNTVLINKAVCIILMQRLGRFAPILKKKNQSCFRALWKYVLVASWSIFWQQHYDGDVACTLLGREH